MSVEIRHVREIIRVVEIAMLPRAPKYFEGIINLRGRIIPVLDLKRRFDMPRLDSTSESRILVVEIEDQMLGLLVDKVSEVLKFFLTSSVLPNGVLLNIDPDFIEKVMVLKNRQILFLNLTKLFLLEDVKSRSEFERGSIGDGKTIDH